MSVWTNLPKIKEEPISTIQVEFDEKIMTLDIYFKPVVRLEFIKITFIVD